jgi:PKD repeat protein
MYSFARHDHGLAWVTLSAISLFVHGCGSMSADNPAGNGTDSVSPASDTLFSTIETPDFGRYDLVARGPDDGSGEWQFAVRSGRGAPAKNELRFVWDFGDGKTYEGVEQSYSFTTNGSYVIKVTAIKLDGTVAFLLTLNVEVAIAVNEPPIADAGTNQTVDANALVFLYGGASSDPDGDPLTYQWVQISGVPVLLLHANEPTASFIAPSIPQDADLVFGVTVGDGGYNEQDTVVVRVLRLVQPAETFLVTADAGADQLNVLQGTTVTLHGRGSSNPNTSPLTYAWSPLLGTNVTLQPTTDPAIVTFTAPGLAQGETSLALFFELVVSAGDQSASDEVRVTVTSESLSGGGVVVNLCAVDSDMDGLNDCEDLCPQDLLKREPGICGCGVADKDTDHDGTPDCIDGCPSDPEKPEPGLCGCGVVDSEADVDNNGVLDCLETDTCVAGTSTWQNFAMPAQTGVFAVQFDAIPQAANIDGLISLSRGNVTSFGQSAVTPRFNVNGFIDAYNANISWYAAETSLPYTPGTRYRFRVEVDLSRHTYSVFVAPPGSAERQIARDYAFRATQASVTSLDTWSVWAGTGSHQVCNFVLGSCLLDSDNDGVPDCHDGCPADPNKGSPGVCGCGVSDQDSDGDGVPDCRDRCPGQVDRDSDGDTVPDCVDVCPGYDDRLDSDGDGVPDGCEPPALSVSVTNLDFGLVGTSLSFQVWNSGGGTLNYSVSDNQTWLTLSPANGGSTGEKDTITATVDRGTLADGDYPASITVSMTGRVVTIAVAMSVGSAADAMPMTAASRTEGVAPLAVFFDAVNVDGWVSGVVQPTDGGYAAPHYEWDFGDAGSGTWRYGRQNADGIRPSKNQAFGYVAAHVFEIPTTYTVTLTVTSPGGQQQIYQQEIVVQPFPGTGRTYYVSSSAGNDANAGTSEAAPFKTWNKGLNMLFSGGGPARLLLNRGDAFITSSTFGKNSGTGPFTIGAYGSGANPVVRNTGSTNTLDFGSGLSDVRIVDVDFNGPYPGATPGTALNPSSQMLLLRSRIANHSYAVSHCCTPKSHVVLADSEFVDNEYYGTFYFYGKHIAVLGSLFQNVDKAHLLRTGVSHSVIGNNTFRGGAVTQLKFGGIEAGRDPAYPYMEYNLVTENEFLDAGPVGWMVTVGPQDNITDERLRNVIVERNVFQANANTGVALILNNEMMTVRDNVFDGRFDTGFIGISIFRRGIEPPPRAHRVYNNTFYRASIAVNLNNISADITVLNNLAAPGGLANAVLLDGIGSGLVAHHNLFDNSPGFVNASAGDFRLLSSSPAIDAGALLGFVSLDFDRKVRPIDGNGNGRADTDIGSFEFGEK